MTAMTFMRYSSPPHWQSSLTCDLQTGLTIIFAVLCDFRPSVFTYNALPRSIDSFLKIFGFYIIFDISQKTSVEKQAIWGNEWKECLEEFGMRLWSFRNHNISTVDDRNATDVPYQLSSKVCYLRLSEAEARVSSSEWELTGDSMRDRWVTGIVGSGEWSELPEGRVLNEKSNDFGVQK